VLDYSVVLSFHFYATKRAVRSSLLACLVEQILAIEDKVLSVNVAQIPSGKNK
jgi:hypothetical protein